jgi:glycosyltransferase involved in cell wall biosynthesis
MAAGCVPVVIGKGGQPELVTHGQDGFLWYTDDELKRYTLSLIADPVHRQEMSVRAIATSRRFDRSHFEERLSTLLQVFVVEGV